MRDWACWRESRSRHTCDWKSMQRWAHDPTLPINHLLARQGSPHHRPPLAVVEAHQPPNWNVRRFRRICTQWRDPTPALWANRILGCCPTCRQVVRVRLAHSWHMYMCTRTLWLNLSGILLSTPTRQPSTSTNVMIMDSARMSPPHSQGLCVSLRLHSYAETEAIVGLLSCRQATAHYHSPCEGTPGCCSASLRRQWRVSFVCAHGTTLTTCTLSRGHP